MPLPQRKTRTHLWLSIAVALAGAAPACRTAGPKAQPAAAEKPAGPASESPDKPAPPSAKHTEIPGDCAALFDAWRKEYYGDDEETDPEFEQEISERAAKFPCVLDLDLDGDGANERVFITSAGPERVVGIGIEWGDSRVSVLGAGSPVEIEPGVDGEDETLKETDFGWIRHWKPAPLVDGAFAVRVLGNTVRFDPPGILGDGIQISGSDAAAIFYFDGNGWRWIHLGF